MARVTQLITFLLLSQGSTDGGGREQEGFTQQEAQAWKKAGAETGWMASGSFRTYPVEGRAGEIPAFSCEAPTWEALGAGKLPAPGRPFGIHFRVIDDARLKDLSRFEHLIALDLSGELRHGYGLDSAKLPVTDETVKALVRLEQVRVLNLANSRVTDAAVGELSRLPDLRELNLSETGLTDAGISRLAALRRLQYLNLSYATHFKGSGLKDLASLPNLRSLNLGSSSVDNEGIQSLGALKRLEVLDLTRLRVTEQEAKALAGLTRLKILRLADTERFTDQGLQHLADLSDLQVLDLRGAGVTDRGMAHLAKLACLLELSLQATDITDAGLKELAPLTGLQEVNLSGTAITDAGLIMLADFKKLKKANVWLTKGTKDGIQRLQRASPGLEIINRNTSPIQ